MKKITNKISSTFFLSLLLTTVLNSSSIVETLEKAVRPSTEKIFLGITEQRQKQLAALKQEREQLAKEKNDSESSIKAELDSLQEQLNQLRQLLLVNPHNEFNKRKSAIINETYQIVKDLQREREQLIASLDDFIKNLQEFLTDPDYVHYKKEQKLVDRTSYSFEDLERLHNGMLEIERKINLIADQEKNAQIELENRKRAAAGTKESYASKKESAQESNKLSVAQYKDITAHDEQLFTAKKRLDELKVKEIEYKINFLALQLAVAKGQRDILRNYLTLIKPDIHVSEVDIAVAKEKVAKEKQEYYEIRQKYRQEGDQLTLLQKQKLRELEQASRQYDLPVNKELYTWDKESIQTVDGYIGFCEIGILNAQRLLLEKKQELVEAQVALQEQKLKYNALELQVRESYYKITTRKFVTEQDIAKELKIYVALQAEAQADLTRYKEKITTVTETLNDQRKVIDAITKLKETIVVQRDTAFKTRPKAFNRCLDLLDQAHEQIKQEIDILGTLIGVDSSIIIQLNNSLRLINFMIAELESKGIWSRPEGAISWAGVKNIGNDISMFFIDIKTYITWFNIGLFWKRITASFHDSFDAVLIIFTLIGLTVGLLLLRRYLPKLASFINFISKGYGGIVRLISLLIISIIGFFEKYFLSISIWLIALSFLVLQEIADPSIYIIFYLISIPYLLYLTYCFMGYLLEFNEKNGYALIAQDYSRRFYIVFSGLLYATISIFFFREAFLLVNYYRSELPTILLALNFIIFQIALILLIDKEQILNIIPTRNDFWLWLREQVDNYYYLILLVVIAVIIMSNPFVGYGTLVLYLFFGVIYSGLLLILIFWLHGLFKKIASKVFFARNDEIVKERFANAKTWFGLSIIISFLFFTLIAVIIAAKIWGWRISFNDAAQLLKEPIMGDAQNPITILSFLKIIAFVLGGFVVAYGLNKFVIDKIFDLLLVEPGVQHTVTSIMQYVVLTVAIFLGFKNAGLDSLVNVLVGGLILGLGWILKEPISDFVAYFIILVQRPVKLDDYIQIDDEIQGVVRRITARSVVLRRKNSFTIVVPNSYVISRAIRNWNYTRGFIAFDDIYITIDYQEDPNVVLKILEQTVESHQNVLRNPRPVVRLESFTEIGFLYLVRGFISSNFTLDQWNIASDIRIAIVVQLRAKGIKIALPTRIAMPHTTKQSTQ